MTSRVDLDYTLKQKILTLYDENHNVADAIVSKWLLPQINETNIASFVKLRNGKHILERLNGEIIQNYMPIISYCICRLFKYVGLPDKLISFALLQIFSRLRLFQHLLLIMGCL